MAITSLDGVIAGMRPPEDLIKVGNTMQSIGVWHSKFYESGRPAAASIPTIGTTGTALTTYTGQIPWVNPSSGNSYLARMQVSTTGGGSLMLADRLWHNSGVVVTTTAAQSVSSNAWPARDRDGSTNGENVLVALEVTATLGATAQASCTISYTNSSGTAGRTGTISAIPTSAIQGTFMPMVLQAGDTGVRSIQTITLSTTMVSGSFSLVAYRQITFISCPQANAGGAVDAISSGFPRLYNSSVLFVCWLASSLVPVDVSGQVIITQG